MIALRTPARILGLTGALGLGACGPADEPAWAFQHGSLVVSDSGEAIEGFQVWEMYAQRWRKKKKEKFHICARVQTVQGEQTSDLEGCAGCLATFVIETEELESDCGKGQGGAEDGFTGMGHFAFGALPKELRDSAPYPGQTMAWYVSWDTRNAELLGYAWNERLDMGEMVSDAGWVAGESYVLWPAYAWEL